MTARLLLWLYAVSAIYVLGMFLKRRGAVAPRFLALNTILGVIAVAGLLHAPLAAPAAWVASIGFLFLLVLPGFLIRRARGAAARMRFVSARRLLGAAITLLPAQPLKAEHRLYAEIAGGGGAAHPAAAGIQAHLIAMRGTGSGRPGAASAGIVAAVLLVHLAATLLGESTSVFTLLKMGANNGPLVMDGDWFRVVTAAFLHIGVLHLVINALGIWIVGGWVEPTLGAAKTYLLFLLASVAGNVASILAYAPDGVISAGASGGAMGLVGAATAISLSPRASPLSRRLLPSLILVAGATMFLGLVEPGIDNSAHGGGIAAGFLLGLLFTRTRVLARGPAAVLCGLFVLTTLAAFGHAALEFGRWERSPLHTTAAFEFERPEFFRPAPPEDGLHVFSLAPEATFTVEMVPRGAAAMLPGELEAFRRGALESGYTTEALAIPIVPGWTGGGMLANGGGEGRRIEAYARRDPRSGQGALIVFLLPGSDEPLRDHVVPVVLSSFRFK